MNAEALAMFFVGYLLIGAVLGLISYLLSSFARMKLFTKAGEAGWKGWIPFYGEYVLYEISWAGKYYWIFLALTALQFVLSMNSNTIMALLSFMAVTVAAALRFIQSIRLAKAFGKGVGTSIGLFFLPPVFLLILGLGNAPYLGVPEV